MKYTVATTAVADFQLANIWIYASNRQQVAEAFNQIESSLRNDAPLQGREHPDGWRVLAVAPIVVTFRVSEDDRLATILSVYYRP